MNTKLISYKIETLLSKSPSVLRIGTAIWPLRIISVILAPVFIISGITIVFLSYAILVNMQENDIFNKFEDAKLLILIAFVGGVGMTIAGILFLIIAWLSRLVRNRNTFIDETKDVLGQINIDLNTPQPN